MFADHMKHSLLTALAANIILVQTTLAATWLEVGVPDNYKYGSYIALDTITGESIKSYWLASINIDKSLNYDTLIVYKEINCNTKQSRTRDLNSYLRG